MQFDNIDFKKISGDGDPQKCFDALFITAQQVANVVGVTTPAVYAAVKTGNFPGPMVTVTGSGVWLWSRPQAMQAIQAWKTQRSKYSPTQHLGRVGAV